MKPDFFFLAIIPLIIICSPVLSQTSELQLFSDSITIDGRTYKVSPDFTIPPGIDKDSPVRLVFTDNTHELLSIERLKDDDSDSDELEYHFGIVNAISRANTDMEYRVYLNISICLIHLMLIPFFPLTLREIAVLGMFLHSVRYLTLTYGE